MSEQSDSKPKSDNRIRGLLRREKYPIPELRPVVDEVFYATQGGPFNVRILASRVEQDPTITKKILEITSNSFFCGSTNIRNINSLIQRFGPSGFRCVALQAFLDLDIYKSQHPFRVDLKNLRDYSLACAHVSRIVSRYTGVNGDLAFLCGLLHRIGMAIPLILHPNYAQSPTESQNFYLSLQAAHPVFGALVSKKWGLPEEVQQSISCHGQIAIDSQTSIYSATVVVAECITRRLGYQLKQFKSKPRYAPIIPCESTDDAMQAVGIPEGTVPQLMRDVHQIMTFDLI